MSKYRTHEDLIVEAATAYVMATPDADQAAATLEGVALALHAINPDAWNHPTEHPEETP